MVGNKIYLFYKLKRTKIKNKSTKFNSMITTSNFFITLKMIFEDNRRQKKEPGYVLAKKQTKTKKKTREKALHRFFNNFNHQVSQIQSY